MLSKHSSNRLQLYLDIAPVFSDHGSLPNSLDRKTLGVKKWSCLVSFILYYLGTSEQQIHGVGGLHRMSNRQRQVKIQEAFYRGHFPAEVRLQVGKTHCSHQNFGEPNDFY